MADSTSSLAIESRPSIAVGLLYNPEVPRVLEAAPEAVHLLSIVPDVLQIDRRRHVGRRGASAQRFADVEIIADIVLSLARHWPFVAHGVGLSIGSPGPLDHGYLRRMREWVERLHLLWYSEHLSFFRLPTASTAAHEVGLACPLPLDHGVLEAIARRSRAVAAAIGVPFLLENGVSYVRPVDDDYGEPEFLNRLCAASGTSLLLDLHNLYVNARNLGVSAEAALDALDLSAVLELHVAGGDMFLDMYTDAHSGAVPEPVWRLLRYALPRLTSLRAITFEYHESVAERLGVRGVLEQLARIREESERAGRCIGAPNRRAHPTALPEVAHVAP